MKILQQLLVPYSAEQFLTEYWTQKAIHIAANDSRKLHSFFSWSALNHLLNYHNLTEPDLRFSKEGQSLPNTHDPQDWSDRLRQGATLIVNGVHQRIPSVAKLAAELRDDIGCETHVNLYCSPADQRGFDCHYDTHDVLILQIEGEKKWFVYKATLPYPTAEMPSSKQDQPTESPYLECVLQAGDVLYIPRGHWHYAIACEQPSLHLTLGLECQTGLDWLDWLRQDLQNSLNWRKSLPVIIDDNTTILKQQLVALRERLIEIIQEPDILDKFIDKLSYRHYPPMPISLPTQMGTDIFPDLMMTQFTWSPLHRIRIKQLAEQHYQIQVGSKQISLKGLPETLVENLFNQNQFSLFDIANWAPDLDLEEDLTPLLRKLILEGVLQVATEALSS
jgi:ribosomal protein L16 Arg81 hydroxylase